MEEQETVETYTNLRNIFEVAFDDCIAYFKREPYIKENPKKKRREKIPCFAKAKTTFKKIPERMSVRRIRKYYSNAK